MKNYCMSSYLTFRFIPDEEKNFYSHTKRKLFKPYGGAVTPCKTADDIDAVLKKEVEKEFIPDKTGIFLSGGIDSAILAAYVPEGTPAYTFKCIAPNAIDETVRAKKYAQKYSLDHRIVEMHWEDFEELAPKLIKHNQEPFNSTEVQIYKAALQAKSEGIEKILIGESADTIFGGMHLLYSKDWTFEEFVPRYTFVDPEKVLKNPVSVREVFERYKEGDMIDLDRFMEEIYYIESPGSFMHAFDLAGVEYADPYVPTVSAEPLDLNRIRNGEPKYLIRELFAKKFPELEIPDKICLPRPMNHWMANWEGPKRDEFKKNCIEGLSGDQKWMLWCLEQFLNTYDRSEVLCK